MLELDQWAKDMVLEAVATSRTRHPSDAAPSATTRARQPTTLWRMECPSTMHSLTETLGSILSDSGFLINTEFGVLGIRPTSGPTYSNTGRPGREYTLCPGLLPALESWVMTDADGHDPMSRRSTRLIPYAAKESQACSQPLNIGTPFLGTRVRGHRLANARARCPRPTCEHSHTRL